MISGYEERLDKLFVEAFPTEHPAMNDWTQTKFELQTLRRTNGSDICVIIDMNNYDIVEYYGPYDHYAVDELSANITEHLDYIEDKIDKSAEWIECNLVWERADPDDLSTEYLTLKYVGKHVYTDENGEEM